MAVLPQLTEPVRFRQRAELRLALAGAEWARAESLAIRHLADPTVHGTVREHSRFTLASVHAARGGIRTADSILGEVQHGNPYSRVTTMLRSLLVVASPTFTPALSVSTTTPMDPVATNARWAPHFWEVARTAVGADTVAALRAAGQLRRFAPPQTALPNARRDHQEHLRMASVLDAAQRGDWEAVLTGTREQLAQRPGALLHLFARWLAATAYDRLGAADSAVVYYERVISPTGVGVVEEYYAMGLTHSLALQRLVVLYSRLNRLEEARRHWLAFSTTFTHPDPEMRPLVEAARDALLRAERARG